MHYGARQYQRTSDMAASPRSIELAVFRETNKRLAEAGDDITRVKALSRNHQMWSTLVKDVGLSSNPLPPILKQDLTSIGLFAMRYSTLAISSPLPIKPLLEINERMIDGLDMQVVAAPAAPAIRALAPAVRDMSMLSA